MLVKHWFTFVWFKEVIERRDMGLKTRRCYLDNSPAKNSTSSGNASILLLRTMWESISSH